MKYGDPSVIIENMFTETLRMHGAMAFAVGFQVYQRLNPEAQLEIQRATDLLTSPDTAVSDKAYCTEYLRSMLELRTADTAARGHLQQLGGEEKASRG